MKITQLLLFINCLYTFNNCEDNRNNNPIYHFYQKLSKIDIHKNKTLEEVVEEISDAYKQINKKTNNIDFKKHCEEQIEKFSNNVLPDTCNSLFFTTIAYFSLIKKFKTVTFCHVVLSLEQLGLKYQENHKLQNLKINFQEDEKETIQNLLDFRFNEFNTKMQNNNNLTKDDLESSRFKNFFYGVHIALDQDILTAIRAEKTINELDNITCTIRAAAALFHYIHNTDYLFDIHGNYIPEKTYLDSFKYLDFYRLLYK